MDTDETVRAERVAERGPRPLEAQIETLLALAWKSRADPGRAAPMARRAAALAASGDASPRTIALGKVARACAAGLEGDLGAVVRIGTSALDALDGLDDAVWQCRLLAEVAVAGSKEGHLADAEPLFERGLRLSREHGLRKAELEFLLNLAQLRSIAGQTDRALTMALEARALAARVGEPVHEGLALQVAGTLYRVLGAYPEATTSLLAAIELFETHHRPGQLATAYCNLSTIYALTGMPAEAIASAREALARLQDAPPSTHDKANALAALGLAHRKAGDVDAALDATERALAMRRRLGFEADAAQNILALGDIHLEAGHLEEAEARYREGLDAAADVDEPRVTLGCKAGLAKVLVARGEFDEALGLAQPLIAEWEHIGEKTALADACDLVAEIQEARGDSAEAFAYVKRARALGEDVFNRESAARLQHLLVTHEVAHERKKAADALRGLSRRVMESQEEERKRVARDLHDDLSQRLAVLALKLDVLGQAPPESAGELREQIGALADGVRGTAEHVHRISHRLHPATLEQLGFVAATQRVCDETAAAHGVAITFLADELPDALSAEVELGLYRIVQEALQNAIRHGDSAPVSVRLFEEPDGTCLQVHDEGPGFDPDALEEPGIGLVGMRERAEHLGGRFAVRSAPGRGTLVEVSVPPPS